MLEDKVLDTEICAVALHRKGYGGGEHSSSELHFDSGYGWLWVSFDVAGSWLGVETGLCCIPINLEGERSSFIPALEEYDDRLMFHSRQLHLQHGSCYPNCCHIVRQHATWRRGVCQTINVKSGKRSAVSPTPIVIWGIASVFTIIS